MTVSVLITGASGFVGKHCVKRFEKDKNLKLILLSRSISPEVGHDQIGLCLKDINEGDILVDVNTVVHIAGLAHLSANKVGAGADEFELINTLATVRLVESLINKGLKRFVYISSVSVYGKYKGVPFSEVSALSPLTDYAKSKLRAEERLKLMSKEFGFELVIVRPPLVYGFGAPGNFGKLVRMVSKMVVLPFGLVNNLRSMISVENLADFIYLCSVHPKAAGELFVVTDEVDLSTRDLTDFIALGLNKRVFQLPISVSVMKLIARMLGVHNAAEQLFGDLRVDSDKARRVLSWKQPYTINTSLQNNPNTLKL
jgi:nucleoside-diphosphate-sugar epimerase